MTHSLGKIKYSSFEGQSNIVGCSTSTGFVIYDLSNGNPISSCEITQNKSFEKGVLFISTLGTSNIVALLPNQENPTKVFIWDRISNIELTSFTYDLPVSGIRLRPDYILCSTTKQIQVRALSDSSLICKFETAFNRDGVFDICSSYSSSIIAYPAPDIGVVTVVDCLDITSIPKYVHAFKTPITFLKFNDNGRLLAVCGDESKSIIVYSLPSFKKIAILKRGLSSSKIYSISFDPHGTQLSISGDLGIIQVFNLHQEIEEGIIKPSYKLNEKDSSPVWICFSSRTLRLIGISSAGNAFRISFNQEDKSANFEMIENKLKLK